MNQKTSFLSDKMFLDLISPPAWNSRCSPTLARARTGSLCGLLDTTQHIRDTLRVWHMSLLPPIDTDVGRSWAVLETEALKHIWWYQGNISASLELWIKWLLHWVGKWVSMWAAVWIQPCGQCFQILNLLTRLIWKPLISWVCLCCIHCRLALDLQYSFSNTAELPSYY